MFLDDIVTGDFAGADRAQKRKGVTGTGTVARVFRHDGFGQRSAAIADPCCSIGDIRIGLDAVQPLNLADERIEADGLQMRLELPPEGVYPARSADVENMKPARR